MLRPGPMLIRALNDGFGPGGGPCKDSTSLPPARAKPVQDSDPDRQHRARRVRWQGCPQQAQQPDGSELDLGEELLAGLA
eukprot:6991105-Alexandrium_andersonii.AAC.1